MGADDDEDEENEDEDEDEDDAELSRCLYWGSFGASWGHIVFFVGVPPWGVLVGCSCAALRVVLGPCWRYIGAILGPSWEPRKAS